MGLKFLIKNWIFIYKDNTLNWVDDSNSKVSRVRFWTKLAKFKNMVEPNLLTKSKLLAKLISKSDFSNLRIRLKFAKLRKIFVKALILCYFDLKYHI